MARALELYWIESTSCKVIPNGRDAAKLPRGLKSPLILTAGRVWDEAKNVAAVVEAANGLAWPVYIAGDAQDVQMEGCHMLGRLPAAMLAEWQARAAIYAAPARYEPFGLSALEAGLSGCALVLGDIESQRDIWGDAALFVSPDDTRALRKTLEILIADRSLRETMAERAYQRALTFDASRMAQGYLDLYKNIISARSEQCVS
jgi:glycosyltransferase involved in cell wall biosynthesis